MASLDFTQEEVVRKTQAFDKLKAEAERCSQQSERFSNEKVEFESSVYSKVVASFTHSVSSAAAFCFFCRIKRVHVMFRRLICILTWLELTRLHVVMLCVLHEITVLGNSLWLLGKSLISCMQFYFSPGSSSKLGGYYTLSHSFLSSFRFLFPRRTPVRQLCTC